MTTTDHKKIGTLYLATSFFFCVGGLTALLMRAEMARPGTQIMGMSPAWRSRVANRSSSNWAARSRRAITSLDDTSSSGHSLRHSAGIASTLSPSPATWISRPQPSRVAGVATARRRVVLTGEGDA